MLLLLEIYETDALHQCQAFCGLYKLDLGLHII